MKTLSIKKIHLAQSLVDDGYKLLKISLKEIVLKKDKTTVTIK